MNQPDKLYLDREFDKFWSKIEHGENFALLRHGDGELAIMKGKSVKAQEGWSAPNHITKLGQECFKALHIVDDKYYIGISCPCCDQKAYYWYMTHGKGKNKTFANIWVNGNYQKFIKHFSSLNRDVIVIANEKAYNKPIGKLNILKFYAVDDDCINFWENNGEQLVSDIIYEYGNQNNILYVISAGPLAGPIINRLFTNNPNNCYIDFGSAIDEFIHSKKTRPYMDSSTIYAKQNCWMYNPKTVSFDVTAICTLYKRPESLIKQVTALENQTLLPKELLLFQDGVADFYRIQMLDTLKAKFTNIRIATENMGVWERFRFAKEAKSPYVCIFDDDTIPGNSWLENCHFQMMHQSGIYGTNGIVMTDKSSYPAGGHFSVGWKGPVNICTEVDFVGHSWFMEKICLDYMFDQTEKFQDLKYVAEDMCLSVKAKEYGIKTFVPPHPTSDMSLWGSAPLLGNVFGQSVEALSFNMDNLKNMQMAIEMFEADGWQPLCMEEPSKVKTALKHVKKERIKNFYCKTKNFFKRKLIKE